MAVITELLNIHDIRMALGFNTETLALILEASSRTIEHWEKTGIPQDAALPLHGRLVKLQELIRLGQAVYGGEGFKRFLKTPLPAFAGKAACQMMLIGDTDKVAAELAADYEGSGY